MLANSHMLPLSIWLILVISRCLWPWMLQGAGR
jgi:hypothetical protein